nr:hypothetical protein [Tanacetum cinerariifolium]
MESTENIGVSNLLGLAAKIRNIDGKPLRSTIHNIVPLSGIEGAALHGNKASVDVNKSPSRVSFAANTRVSLINPNTSFIGKPNDTCLSSVENIWGPTTGIGGSFSMGPDVEMPANTMESTKNIGVSNLLGLASKIRNIDGKPLHSAIRNIVPSSGIEGAALHEMPANSVKDMMPAKPKHVQHNSFVSIVQNQPSKKVVKIKELRNEERVKGAAVAIPLDEVEAISSHFVNTLYGYFIGNRLAFPLVENYVKNTWAKYGLKHIQLHEEFFLFQFHTKEGMERVLEDGPWLIRREPLILNIWSQSTDLKKAEIKKAPVPPRCSTCLIFDHVSDKCPKLPKVVTTQTVADDGFAVVKKKKNKSKNKQHKQVDGVILSKPSLNLHYRKVDKGQNSSDKAKSIKEPNVKEKAAVDKGKVQVSNSFNALDNDDDEFWGTQVNSSLVNESDSEDVDENIIVEEPKSQSNVNGLKGASTPDVNVSMCSIASWNIRGLNFSPKQKQVRQVVYENKLSVCAILESHAHESKLEKLCSYVFNHWEWISNGSICSKGTRIIVGWNRNDVDVSVITHDDQVIHTRIWIKTNKKEVFFSFVYAHNHYIHRRALWQNLGMHYVYIRKRPRCLLGDFNSAISLDDMLLSSSTIDISIREFKECGHEIFQPYRISDHSPAMLCLPSTVSSKPRPFKFTNILVHNTRFKEVVLNGWNKCVIDFHMFKVVYKLKCMKKPF